MTCEECKAMRAAELAAKPPETIPYYTHEKDMARLDRSNKRLLVALVIAFAMIFVSNAMWLYAWTQYDYTSEETVYTQDGEGTNIIGSSNEVDYGAE